MASLNLAAFNFESQKDVVLRILFQTAASQLIWDHFFQGLDLANQNFNNWINLHFDEAIEYLQDKTLPILGGMFSMCGVFTPEVTIEDIFEFFNTLDPLGQLNNHQHARQGLKFCLHTRFLQGLYQPH